VAGNVFEGPDTCSFMDVWGFYVIWGHPSPPCYNSNTTRVDVSSAYQNVPWIRSQFDWRFDTLERVHKLWYTQKQRCKKSFRAGIWTLVVRSSFHGQFIQLHQTQHLKKIELPLGFLTGVDDIAHAGPRSSAIDTSFSNSIFFFFEFFFTNFTSSGGIYLSGSMPRLQIWRLRFSSYKQ
jgi:hypothetical protein